jgi:NADH-quinone oxidoreductase subunit N
MAFFLLSLIGIPFTGGFFGKFYIFSATLHANVTWLTVIGLLNSGLAGFYYLRLLISLYGKPEADAMAEPQPRLRGSLAFALLLTISATLILGIFPGRILTAAGAGAATYAGSNPSPGLARNQAPNTARMQPGR